MTADDGEKVYLSKTTNTRRTTTTSPSILATPPTSPSRGGTSSSSSASNKHRNKRHSSSSNRKGRTSSSKVQLADGDNRESSNSRRSSKRTASNIELSPSGSNKSSSKRSSRKINLQLADGDANHHQKSPHKPSSSSRRSSSRRSSSRRHNKTTSRHHNDTHVEDTSNSSSEHEAPGAFPVDSLNPQSANSTTTHTITSHDSDVMIAAEISPDREDEVRQAYQRGAEDMRNALQQNDQLRLRVRELEEQNNGGGDNVIVAVAREDDEDDDKKKFSKGTICGCFVLGILVLAGAIVGSIYGIRQSDPVPSNDPTIIVLGPPTLQDCESVVNETEIVDPDFVQNTLLYLDMAVLQESNQGMTQSELDNLQQRILLYILTVLLGCDEQAIQTLEEEILGTQQDSTSTRWLLQEENNDDDDGDETPADDWYTTSNATDIFQEYVVGNTVLWDLRVWPFNEACTVYYPDSVDSCTHVRMVLEVSLRTKIPEDDLAWAVLEEFQREPLVSRLKLDRMENNPYELIDVVNLDLLPDDYIFEPSLVSNTTMSPVPTVAPSPPIVANFSSAPSTSPSISPSISLGQGGNGDGDNGNGGDNPAITTPEPTTPNPSLSPTDVPSMPPSPPPTVLPSQSPSQRPTVSPTRNPTRNPTPGPTPNPTTPPPTRAPTPQPSPAPTARPTPFPSPPPSASPSACSTPSCSGTLTCTSFTDTMTIHPCGSCSLDQDCSYAGSMTIGFNSCNGKEECNAGYGNVIGDHSCNGNDATWDGVSGTHSCAHLHSVQIGDDSCNCAECCACFDYGVIKGNNECNTPGECCTVFGGTKLVGTGSCGDAAESRTYSCLGSKGTIGMNSCNGMEACKNKRDVVGDGSCIGVLSCGYHTGDVGDGSCLGFKACQGNWDAFIGDGSCNGTDACKQVNNASIGDGSCNCQACCACLPDGVIVPDGSCNVRAASPGAIDFVSGVGGTACCYYSTLPP